jgi:hypothetical protein
MAVSAELLCRHSFGRRYKAALSGSFVLALVYGALNAAAYPHHPSRYFGVYLWLHFILLCVHLAGPYRRRAHPLHSYSTGQSWPVWGRLPIPPNIVQLVGEPGIVILFGASFYPVDIPLSVWLQIAGLSLFAKELIGQWRQRNRLLDTLDARADGERLNATVRRHTAPESEPGRIPTPVTTGQAAAAGRLPMAQLVRRLDPALQRLMTADETHGPVPIQRAALPPVDRRPTGNPRRIVVRPPPRIN